MPKPIEIESTRRDLAQRKLEEICNKPTYRDNGYALLNLVNETNETLLVGISTKMMNKREHVWSEHGWVIKP